MADGGIRGSGLRIDVHHHLHLDGVPSNMILTVLSALRRIEEGQAMASAAVEHIRSEVAEARSVAESAVALLQGLATQIRELKEDPAALEQLATDLDASTNALAAAVTENTPQSG